MCLCARSRPWRNHSSTAFQLNEMLHRCCFCGWCIIQNNFFFFHSSSTKLRKIQPLWAFFLPQILTENILLLFSLMTLYLHPWTYPNKGPVTKVVDCAEEPELVEEKIGSCHSALVWKGQRNHKKTFSKILLLLRVYKLTKHTCKMKYLVIKVKKSICAITAYLLCIQHV